MAVRLLITREIPVTIFRTNVRRQHSVCRKEKEGKKKIANLRHLFSAVPLCLRKFFLICIKVYLICYLPKDKLFYGRFKEHI